MEDDPRPGATPSGSTVVHPLVANVFDALDRAGLTWALMRGDDALDTSAPDIDLLLLEADIAGAAGALEHLNFARLPGWGRGSHRFFLTYNAEHDAWVKLDIITELSFGANAEVRTGCADDCLARRVPAEGAWVLDDDDRFWALLLHCALDRADVPDRHARSMNEMSATADGTGPLGSWFAHHAPDGWTTDRALHMARVGDLEPIADLRRRMRADRRWRSPSSILVSLRREALRRLTKVRKLTVQRGFSVALLGPDGVGKSTLSKALGQTFYFPVRSVYMGLYGAGPSGRPPRGMLGRLGRQWNGYLQAMLHQSRGRLVVFDRFSYDASLRRPSGARLRARARSWLLSRSVPAPDLIVVLDAPAELLRTRKDEHGLKTLEAQRHAYLELATRLKGVEIVRADRSTDEVRRDVTARIWKRYVERWRSRAADGP
jgi:thymidylate kinase